MIKVKEIALSRLHKIEVRALLEDVIIILEKHNPETYRLQDLYEILLEQTAKVQIFTEPYGPHASTYFMNQFHKKRLESASSISMQVKALGKTGIEEIQSMAKIARKLSKEHLTYLGRKNRLEVNSHLSLFFRNLKSSFYTEDREAFIGLGLQPYMDELKEANILYHYHSNKRSTEIDNRPPTGDRLLKRESEKRLRLFFDQVNSFQDTFKEIDYTPLISSLNVTLTGYSKSINTRIATNKRKAKKKAAAAKRLAAKKNNDVNKTGISESNQTVEPLKNEWILPLNDHKIIDDMTSSATNKKDGNIKKDTSKGKSKPKRRK